MPESAQRGIRLQKYLADKGLGSRRKIETWITEGRIRIDGRAAQLGDRVTEQSRISVNGRPLQRRVDARQTRVIMYNKPEGEICSRDDPGDRPTVFRRLPKLKGSRWVVVGRLDLNTRGLLLFTNNGDLANQLMHPEFGLEREYLCRVFGNVDDAAIRQLTEGIVLDGETAKFLSVKRQRGEGRNTWYNVVVAEGRYREVRRMWESVGCRVSRLVRVRYGSVVLPKTLRQGGIMQLKPTAVSKLSGDDQTAEQRSVAEPRSDRRKPGISAPGRSKRPESKNSGRRPGKKVTRRTKR